MRAEDSELGDEILEPTLTFMRAQTDKARLSIWGMGPYLVDRDKEVRKAYVLSFYLHLYMLADIAPTSLLYSLMRLTMGLSVTPKELASVQRIEPICAKHHTVLNDIFQLGQGVLGGPDRPPGRIGHLFCGSSAGR